MVKVLFFCRNQISINLVPNKNCFTIYCVVCELAIVCCPLACKIFTVVIFTWPIICLVIINYVHLLSQFVRGSNAIADILHWLKNLLSMINKRSVHWCIQHAGWRCKLRTGNWSRTMQIFRSIFLQTLYTDFRCIGCCCRGPL